MFTCTFNVEEDEVINRLPGRNQELEEEMTGKCSVTAIARVFASQQRDRECQ